MVPNTTASPSTGRHCAQVKSRRRGRPTANRMIAATYWRTATTPTGPRTGKASEPIAAPTWFDRPLPTIVTTPASRPPEGTGAHGGVDGVEDTETVAGALRMSRSCDASTIAQNAFTARSIHLSH